MAGRNSILHMCLGNIQATKDSPAQFGVPAWRQRSPPWVVSDHSPVPTQRRRYARDAPRVRVYMGLPYGCYGRNSQYRLLAITVPSICLAFPPVPSACDSYLRRTAWDLYLPVMSLAFSPPTPTTPTIPPGHIVSRATPCRTYSWFRPDSPREPGWTRADVTRYRTAHGAATRAAFRLDTVAARRVLSAGLAFAFLFGTWPRPVPTACL